MEYKEQLVLRNLLKEMGGQTHFIFINASQEDVILEGHVLCSSLAFLIDHQLVTDIMFEIYFVSQWKK